MTIGLGHYLTVAAILFTLGIFGIFVNRKNVIIILMSIELILLAVNINLVAFSAYLGDLVGQVFAMFVLTVAAAEAAIGLAILVVYFRNRGSIEVEDINLMRGCRLPTDEYHSGRTHPHPSLPSRGQESKVRICLGPTLPPCGGVPGWRVLKSVGRARLSRRCSQPAPSTELSTKRWP